MIACSLSPDQPYLLLTSLNYFIIPSPINDLIKSLILFVRTGLKQIHWISSFGLIFVILGELVRKYSMFTASTNFNHYVQYTKQEGHELVTHGIYSLCRHPSYVGWFYWSVGTQVIDNNLRF